MYTQAHSAYPECCYWNYPLWQCDRQQNYISSFKDLLGKVLLICNAKYLWGFLLFNPFPPILVSLSFLAVVMVKIFHSLTKETNFQNIHQRLLIYIWETHSMVECTNGFLIDSHWNAEIFKYRCLGFVI